jgi:dienelactone hydrolase
MTHSSRIRARDALLATLLLLPAALPPAFAQQTAQDNTAQTQPGTETPSVSESDSDAVPMALAVLDEMDAGRFDAVHARFDERMSAALGVDQLKQVWVSLPAQLGAAKGRGEPRSTTRDGTRIVTVPLMFENATLNASLSFEPDGRISGFLLRPAAAPAAAAIPAPPVPEGANYREIELRVGDGDTALPATLALPAGDGPFPAVVLVHGSGPHDRDQTIGPNKPFLDIARGLAERGIAVLRYEKRSKARPQDYAGGVTIDNETTDDALLAVAALRAQPEVDPKRVFVFGHSQGGMMAPRIGARDPQIAGLILLAAPARPLLDLVIEQNRRLAILNDGKLSDQENTAIQRLASSVEAFRSGRELTPAQLPLGMPADYWRSVEAVDPVAEAAKIAQPMLILQGARDIQVVDADWQRWKGAYHGDPRVAFKLYETLTHLAIPGEGKPEDYQQPGHVAPELVADVAAWIGAQRPAGGK